MKAQRLSQLDIQTVGLVPAGADQDAYIALAKSAPKHEEDSMAKTDELIAAIKGLDDEGRSALVAALTGGDEAPAAEAATAETTTTDDAPAAVEAVAGAEVEKSDDAPAAEPEAVTEPVAVTATEEPAAVAEESSVAAEVAKGVELVSKAEFTQVQKELSEAREAIAKAREEREVRDEVDSIRKSFPELGDDATKLAEAKYRMAKGTATETDVTFVLDLVGKLYKAVQESALFEEFGSAQDGDASPEALIEKAADEIQAANPSMSRPQAIAKAVTMGSGRKAFAETIR